jgi:hypothetical protein
MARRMGKILARLLGCEGVGGSAATVSRTGEAAKKSRCSSGRGGKGEERSQLA